MILKAALEMRTAFYFVETYSILFYSVTFIQQVYTFTIFFRALLLLNNKGRK